MNPAPSTSRLWFVRCLYRVLNALQMVREEAIKDKRYDCGDESDYFNHCGALEFSGMFGAVRESTGAPAARESVLGTVEFELVCTSYVSVP